MTGLRIRLRVALILIGATICQTAWAGNVLFLSRFHEDGERYASPNAAFIDELRAAGHEIDLRFAGELTRPIRFDAELVAAANAADLIIVPPSNPTRDTLSFGGCGPRVPNERTFAASAIDATFYLEVNRPMLILDGVTALGTSITASVTAELQENMTLVVPEHRYLQAIDATSNLFDWQADAVEQARSPTITLPGRAPASAVLATFNGRPFLVDEDVPGLAASPRVLLGHWDHDLSGADFYSGTTESFRRLLNVIVSDLLSNDASSHSTVVSPLDPAYDFDGDGAYGVGDIRMMEAAIERGDVGTQFDLNGDLVVDRQDRHDLIENRFQTYIGDSNLDGLYSSADLVSVFRSGLFESGQEASWEQGDWTGDRLFDAADFVTAFTTGGYCAGPRAAMPAGNHAVPEPSSILWSLLGFVIVWTGRRRNFQR